MELADLFKGDNSIGRRMFQLILVWVKGTESQVGNPRQPSLQPPPPARPQGVPGPDWSCNFSNEASCIGAMPHKCRQFCLGPLTFDSQMVGDHIRLSKEGRQAKRVGHTFKDGLLFFSRSVRINERIRLKVQKHTSNWKGAMRLGFTNLPPSARSQPLPSMAIPDLTDLPGHWVSPVHESLCLTGLELEFWVSHHGELYCKGQKSGQQKLRSGVDLSRPLWALIDLYGQTTSVFLQGSEIKDWWRWHPRRSCQASEVLIEPQLNFKPNPSSLSDSLSCMDISAGHSCVVCMVQDPTITLPCGHRCLCHNCVFKVLELFGTCPLCRHDITAPFEISGPV